MDAVNDMGQNILEMKNIEKAFAVPVLKGVDFSIKAGEVHALVGGNGAGKSTLMKIMTGVYAKDAGEIWVDGKKTSIQTIHDAKKHGIAMIFQELSLVQSMTVYENIFLGQELKRKGMRDLKAMRARTEALLAELGIQMNPDTKISELSVGMSQLVEIAKAMSKEAKILVFDEPTASLSDAETAHLFQIIGRLKEKGVSVVYISHRMNEILKMADSITILRDGNVVHRGSVREIDLDGIISCMMGASSGNKFIWKEREYNKNQEELLSVRDLCIDDRIKNINFSLKKGEIIGIAGLMGSGRTELLEVLFGLRRKQSGEVFLGGKKVDNKNPREAVGNGFALIPEDRRRQGLILIHSVKENAILPKVSRLKKNGVFINEKLADKIVEKNIEHLGIVTDGIHKRIGLLSGGNQQKIVIAKWLNMDPLVMMLDEPTAGVDIGAKGEIIQLIRQFADQGKGVIFVSSELTELMAVCDKIYTIYEGKMTGELDRKEIKTEEELQHAIQRKK